MSLLSVVLVTIALRASADDLWCLSNAPSNKCGHCQTEEDCGNKNNAFFYCSNMRDAQCGPAPSPAPGPTPGPPSPPSPPPGPATAWCKKGSPQNSCQPCDGQESACGNDDPNKFFCLASKDPACSGPAPGPGPSPGPGPNVTSWCRKSSPVNSCGPCNGQESACGNNNPKEFFCLAAKEPACSGPAPGPAPTAWCKHDSPQNACKGCDGQESACGNEDPNKYFCLASEDPVCTGPGPSPSGGGYCAVDSPQNACGRCPTMSESECGNNQPGVYKCWGLPDQRCPHANATASFLI